MNGFYPVLNAVHDKAVKDLPLAECALFEHIWRKLIGWNQFKDKISITQLVSETSSTRGTIIRLTKHLEDKRWIIISREMDGKVNLTNQISIPECPGIKTKLGWCQNSTTPSVKTEPRVVPKQDEGVVSKQDTQQTVLTDNLKTKQAEPRELSPSADDSDQDSALSETDQFIKLLQDKFKMPSMPVHRAVENMVHKYGMESCVAAMEASEPRAKQWSGKLNYISKKAADLSGKSRGVTGEKLDKLEKAYRELWHEVTEYRKYFDANKDRFPTDKERKDSAKWLDRNESQLALMRHTIEENGGNLDIRR